MNTFEIRTTKDALEKLVIIKDSLSNLQSHGCLELTTSLIYIERCITTIAAVLECEK